MCSGLGLSADCGLSYQHLHPQSSQRKVKCWDPWTPLTVHMAAGSKILDCYMVTSICDL